jgi:uncharacterized protein
MHAPLLHGMPHPAAGGSATLEGVAVVMEDRGDMAMPTTFSLRDLGLQAGQARAEELECEVVPYRQAGTDYAPAASTVPVRLDVTAMQNGHSFRLRLTAQLHGPCARCLEDAVVPIHIDTHEVHDPHAADAEVESDFVTGDDLDVTAWAQDAIGLEFPSRVLCTPDCKGLCPGCGINRNKGTCDCDLSVKDTRWDKLRDLKLDDG